MYCVHAWCPWKSEEGAGCPRTEVTDGCKSLCGSWELVPDPLQEQPVLLTTEKSLSSFFLFWLRKGFTVYSRLDWLSLLRVRIIGICHHQQLLLSSLSLIPILQPVDFVWCYQQSKLGVQLLWRMTRRKRGSKGMQGRKDGWKLRNNANSERRKSLDGQLQCSYGVWVLISGFGDLEIQEMCARARWDLQTMNDKKRDEQTRGTFLSRWGPGQRAFWGNTLWSSRMR